VRSFESLQAKKVTANPGEGKKSNARTVAKRKYVWVNEIYPNLCEEVL
jgi:hypothetical protein